MPTKHQGVSARTSWIKRVWMPVLLVPLGLWMSIGGQGASVAGSVAVTVVAFAAPWLICWASLRVPRGSVLLIGALVALVLGALLAPLVVAGTTWAWFGGFAAGIILATAIL